jgi:hypothetical protein
MAIGVALGVVIVRVGLACVFDLRGLGSRRVLMAANSGRGRGYAEHAVVVRVAVGLVITAIGIGFMVAAAL